MYTKPKQQGIMTNSPLASFYVNDVIETAAEKYGLQIGTPEYKKLASYMYDRNNMEYSLTGWWEDDVEIAEDFVLTIIKN